jgi:NitT/TauT family transport system substrate-binding protein
MSKFGLSTLVAAVMLAAAPAHAVDVLVTQYKADPSGAPFGVAIEKGFFKKAGSNITGVISGAGGGASVRATIASDLGYGETSPAGVITAIQQGQDVRIVNIGSRKLDLSLIVMPNSPIKTIQDLKGKKFAISNPRSLGEMMAVMVLEKAGLKSDDMPRVALGSLGGALTALEKGAVDATAIPSILLRQRGATKYRTVIGPADLPRLPSAIGIATTAMMKKNPDQLRALLAGRAEAVRYMNANPEETVKILTKVWEPLPAADVAAIVPELLAAQYWSEGEMEMDLLTNTVQAMRYVGLIEKEPNLNEMIDLSFLPPDLQKKK